jgi:hypothetical protein
MTHSEAIKNLRHGGVLDMWDKVEKLFVKIQLNRQETKFVCWQRFTAKQRGNWTKQNDYLSLKDVMKIRLQIAMNTQTANQ